MAYEVKLDQARESHETEKNYLMKLFKARGDFNIFDFDYSYYVTGWNSTDVGDNPAIMQPETPKKEETKETQETQETKETKETSKSKSGKAGANVVVNYQLCHYTRL